MQFYRKVQYTRFTPFLGKHERFLNSHEGLNVIYVLGKSIAIKSGEADA